MKILSNVMFLALCLGLVFTSCKKNPEGKAAKTADKVEKTATAANAKAYTMDKGTAYWAATKVGGGHNGTINISSGALEVVGNKLTGGSFVIDINSLACTDLKPGDGKEDLEGHLKTGDFFEAEKYPTASFTITSAKPLVRDKSGNTTITGNLTLKGQTKSVSFPASVAVIGNKVNAVTPKFTINRTEWGIKYGSGLIGTAKDKVIHDDVSLSMELMASIKK